MKKTIKAKGKKCNLPNDATNEDIRKALGQYCPFCAKKIYPCNVSEVMSGLDDRFIFLHDEGVAHDEDYNFSELH